jgi:hypothetical protein
MLTAHIRLRMVSRMLMRPLLVHLQSSFNLCDQLLVAALVDGSLSTFVGPIVNVLQLDLHDSASAPQQQQATADTSG